TRVHTEGQRQTQAAGHLNLAGSGLHDSSDAGAGADLRSRPSIGTLRLSPWAKRPAGGGRGGGAAVSRPSGSCGRRPRGLLREHSPCRPSQVGSASDRRSARASSDQDVAGLPRGRNRRSGSEDAHDRSPGQAAWHSAGLADLTLAGEYLHAPVRAGMEDVRARANPRRTPRNLRGRPRDPVQKRQGRRSHAATAADYGQAEADSERGEDTDLHSAGRRVRLPGIHVRTDVFGDDRGGPYRLPAVKEKHSARGRESPRADRPSGNMARDHDAGEQSEPYAARVGELLPSRDRQQGVSGARRLHSGAVAPVVALQAQSQATKGRKLSALAPLRALGLVRLSRLGHDVSWTKA